QMQVREMSITGGDLEALTLEAYGAIGAALSAFDLDAERCAQRIAPRGLTCHGGACQIPIERCRADLAVHRAVVLLGDPRLSSEVQLIEREVGLPFEHREQPAFDPRPEVLLLAVDVNMDSSPYSRVCSRAIYVLPVRHKPGFVGSARGFAEHKICIHSAWLRLLGEAV